MKILITEAQLEKIKKVENPKFSAGCLMVDLKNTITNWGDLLKLIDPEDVYNENGLGLEKEPHTTALFGFDKSVTLDQVKDITKNVSEVKIKLKTISHFSIPERDYDVVKIDVESEDLTNLHELCKELPHKLNFPDYHPHITLAYVVKGSGKKYNKEIKDIELSCDTLKFSNAKKEKHIWKIKNKINENLNNLVKISPSSVFSYINKLHKNGWEQRKYEDKEWVLSHEYFVEEEISLDDPRVKWTFKHPLYSDLSTDFPPIVVGSNGYIMDGTHRAGSAKERGDKTIRAYIGVNGQK